MTSRVVLEDSPLAQCRGKNSRENSIDFSVSSICDYTKHFLAEPISRGGRKPPISNLIGDRELQLSAVKRSSPLIDAEKKDSCTSSYGSCCDENEFPGTYPKRLQRLSLTLPGAVSAVDSNCQTHHLSSVSSPPSDSGTKLHFQHEGFLNTAVSSAFSSPGIANIKFNNEKSNRMERSKICSDIPGIKTTNDDEMQVKFHRRPQIQPQKLAVLENGVESKSPSERLPTALHRRHGTPEHEGAIFLPLEEREVFEKNAIESGQKDHYPSIDAEQAKMDSMESPDKQLLGIYRTPAKSRGARFVEVEVQKISRASPSASSTRSGNNDSDSNSSWVGDRPTGNACHNSDNFNLVILDENVALKNDRILQDKFLEAKSLNRRNGTGSTMHNFSLWGGGIGAPVNVTPLKESSSNMPTSATEAKGSTSKESPPDALTDRSLAQPKYVVRSPKHARSPKYQISKLRGPLAARGMHASGGAVVRVVVSRPHNRVVKALNGQGNSDADASDFHAEERDGLLKKGEGEKEYCTEDEDHIHGDSEGYDTDKAPLTKVKCEETSTNRRIPSRQPQDQVVKQTTIPPTLGRARLSDNLRTVVGHAQSLADHSLGNIEGNSHALLWAPKLKRRMKAGDGDRTTCRNATKAESRPARKPLQLAAGNAVSVVQDEQTNIAAETSECRSSGKSFPRIGVAGSTRLSFEAMKESASGKDCEDALSPDSLLDPHYAISDCEACDGTGYDSERNSELCQLKEDRHSRNASRGPLAELSRFATTTLNKLDVSRRGECLNDDHLNDNSDGDSDMRSVEEESLGGFQKNRMTPSSTKSSKASEKFRSEKVPMDKNLFCTPSSPNLTSEIVIDSPSIRNSATKPRTSFVETHKCRGNGLDGFTSHILSRDANSPPFLSSLVRHASTAPHAQRSITVKAASPKQPGRMGQTDRDAISITSASVDNSASRALGPDKRLSKVLDYDNIKPVKLFYQSQPTKTESAGDTKRDGLRSNGRGYPPVPSLASVGKVGTPPNSAFVAGKRDSPAAVKSRAAKAPSGSPLMQSTETLLPAQKSSGHDNDVNSSLLSLATILSENPPFTPPFGQVKGDAQAALPTSLRMRVPDIPLISKQPVARPLSSLSVNVADASGRASPTLSELSQEDRHEESDGESDITGLENMIHPAFEEIDIDDKTSSANIFSTSVSIRGGATVNRNSSGINTTVFGDTASVRSEKDPKVRSASITEAGACDGPDAGSGAIGSPLRWRRGQAIGEGTFGRVYKGMNERTGELLAVKQLSLAEGTKAEVMLLRKEIQVMWNLSHENIVRYLGTAQSEKYLFIILEYVPGGSIQSMLSQFGIFSESLIWRFSSQILAGVEYLHLKGVIHRDIKGANVLVTDAGVAKLADFGCSKQLTGLCTASLEESLRAIRGSVPWMAPEVIKQSGHGRSSDIWSFGATLIEMATGKPPWPEFTNNLAALFHVATSPIPPPTPKNLSNQCALFLSRCMVIDAAQRATASELSKDPFMISPQHAPAPK